MLWDSARGVLALLCTWSQHLPISLVDEWIREDIPFADLTTSILGVADKPARAKIMLREKAVICGLLEARAVYERLGAKAEALVQEGSWAMPSQEIMQVHGSGGSLHAGWRVAQALIAIGSAVATYTRLMVEKARRVNPGVVIAVARKAPPGLRYLYYHCVFCGGATMHRIGISDTVLVFPNHTRLLGGLKRVIERLESARSLIGERQVVVEVDSVDEAVAAARSGVVDEVQLDHVTPKELRGVVKKLRAINPDIRVAVGGGITLENVEEYAATGVDVIVTSAPFWTKPIDLTTRIEPV